MTAYLEKLGLHREATTPTLDSVPAQVGDQVRVELAVMWRALTSVMQTAQGAARLVQLLVKWVPLLERPHIVAQVDNPVLVARFLAELQVHHKGLAPTLVHAMCAFASARPLGSEVRKQLRTVARREAELDWTSRIEVAILGFPESLVDLCDIFSQTTMMSLEVARRYQRKLLTLPADAVDERRAAFRAFYAQPAADFAEWLLTELRMADPPAEVWEGVALAALERPRIQRSFLNVLDKLPRPGLREVVAQIASIGALGVEAQARTMLVGMVPGPRAAGLPTPLPRLLPWSEAGRACIKHLAEGGPYTPDVMVVVKPLIEARTSGAADLVLELIEVLVSRLQEVAIKELFVEMGLVSFRPQVLHAVAKHLLAEVRRNGPLAVSQRRRFAARAVHVTEWADQLMLYRLALPDACGEWLACVNRLVPETALPIDDFAVALAVAGHEPQPLVELLTACTPNQRRALVKQAPLAAREVRALVDTLSVRSPATLVALCERLATTGPAELAILRELASGTMPGVRRAAVDALGQVGGREELVFLGGLAGIDTRAARGALVTRLREAGESFEPGALGLALDQGALAFTTDEVLAEPEAQFVPPDPRFRLPPAPRGVPAHVAVVFYVLGANGVGFVFGNLFVLVLGASIVKGAHWTALLGSAGLYLVSLGVGGAPRALRAMRHGELWTAGVRVRGNHHALTMLTESGEVHEHVITDTRRSKKLLDEPQEPVLVMTGPDGRPTAVVPVDELELVRVSERGTWRLSGEAWGMLVLSAVIWLVWGVLQ